MARYGNIPWRGWFDLSETCLPFFRLFFFLFLLRALSLPQPCRQEGGKCYFTAQTRQAQYWEIIRKKENKGCWHFSRPPRILQCYQCWCCLSRRRATEKKRNLAGASSLIYFFPDHYLIFGINTETVQPDNMQLKTKIIKKLLVSA